MVSLGSGLLNFSVIFLAFVGVLLGLVVSPKQNISQSQPKEFVVEEDEGGQWKLSDDELTAYLLFAGWPKAKLADAKKVISCESGGNPFAYNRKTKDYGLFQINYRWHKSKIERVNDLYSPLTNLRIGWEIYKKDGGWAPWKASNPCHRLLG